MGKGGVPTAVFDTNVFVAAGFNPGSASAALIEAVRQGPVALVCTSATRWETRAVLTRVPWLSWEKVASLFRPQTEYSPEAAPDASFVADPGDRKLAALAQASGAVLVSSDRHLVAKRDKRAGDRREIGQGAWRNRRARAQWVHSGAGAPVR
jgi:predicted nucleic acid-binding protein